MYSLYGGSFENPFKSIFPNCKSAASGMRPKTLQIILEDSNVGITMNLYVHVTGEEKVKEVKRMEKSLLAV